MLGRDIHSFAGRIQANCASSPCVKTPPHSSLDFPLVEAREAWVLTIGPGRNGKFPLHRPGYARSVGASERIRRPPKGSLPGMKTKKPRSAKAVKPAGRAVRRVTRKKSKTLRRKASPAKVKRAKSKRTKRPASPIRRKTKAAARTKRTRKRVTRRPRTKPSPIPVEGGQLELLAVAAPEPELGLASSEQVESGLSIPQILLEEDQAAPLPMTGPGQKYALGPTAPTGQVGHEEAALPAAYGTGKLLLAARDPHWLYAHWDLTPPQQRRYNALSADRHLVVRVYSGPITGQPLTEVHVHPESRHWFIHVDRAETQYVARARLLSARTPVGGGRNLRPGSHAAGQRLDRPDRAVRHHSRPCAADPACGAGQAGHSRRLPPLEAARERALAELVALHAEPQEG